MKLSIIIPVFNEERTIEQIIKQVANVELPKGISKEIIVIDDGSTDRTVPILKSLKSNFKFLKHSQNQGKGAAVATGFKNASGEILIVQDADLEYDPSYYSKLIEPIINNQADVVYGTRLKNYPLKFWGANKTVLPLHLIANKLLTWMTNILYFSNLSDMETCYKMMKTADVEDIVLRSKRFDFEPEITAKLLKKGLRIKEISIKTKPRDYNEGKKIGWSDGVYAIWALLKYRFVD